MADAIGKCFGSIVTYWIPIYLPTLLKETPLAPSNWQIRHMARAIAHQLFSYSGKFVSLICIFKHKCSYSQKYKI